jgi:hypothetical protein
LLEGSLFAVVKGWKSRLHKNPIPSHVSQNLGTSAGIQAQPLLRRLATM